MTPLPKFHDPFVDVIKEWPLRPLFKIANFESKDELRKAIFQFEFTVEDKKGNLLETMMAHCEINLVNKILNFLEL